MLNNTDNKFEKNLKKKKNLFILYGLMIGDVCKYLILCLS